MKKQRKEGEGEREGKGRGKKVYFSRWRAMVFWILDAIVLFGCADGTPYDEGSCAMRGGRRDGIF